MVHILSAAAWSVLQHTDAIDDDIGVRCRKDLSKRIFGKRHDGALDSTVAENRPLCRGEAAGDWDNGESVRP